MKHQNAWIYKQDQLTMEPSMGILLAVAVAFIVGGLLVSGLGILAIGICVYICLEYDVDSILDMLMLILPLSPVFKLGGISGFACYNILLLVATFKILVTCNMTFLFPDTTCFLLLMYIVCGIKNADITAVIRFAVQMIICMQVLNEPVLRNRMNFQRKNIMMAIGVVLSSCIGVMHDYFPGVRRLYLEYGTRIKLGSGIYFSRFMGVETNPNMYTVLISVCIAVYFVYYIAGRMRKTDWLLVMALIIFGLMTVSMSFILTLGITVGIAFLMACRRKPNLVFYAVPIAVISLVILSSTSIGRNILETILFRFENQLSDDSGVDTLTTGRSDYWLQYIDYFARHPMKTIIGAGLDANLDGLPNSHNYYLETVYYLGIIGTILYIISLVSIFSPRRYTNRKTEFYMILPFLCIFIRGMARNLICEEKLMMIYLLSTFAAYDVQMGTET